MDVIKQLLESRGKMQIIAAVDRFRKMAHFLGQYENRNGKDLAHTFLRAVCKLH